MPKGKAKLAFEYHVFRVGIDNKHFRVAKYDPNDTDNALDMYDLVVDMSVGAGDNPRLWCDCPGFRRQTYSKVLHKHVQLVIDFMSVNPTASQNTGVYQLGPKNEPLFQRHIIEE